MTSRSATVAAAWLLIVACALIIVAPPTSAAASQLSDRRALVQRSHIVCPQLFEYRVRSDHYLFGLLTVPSPALGRRRVPLLVAFQLRARLPTVSV